VAGHWPSVFAYCDVVGRALAKAIAWDTPAHSEWTAAAEAMRTRLAVKAATALAENAAVGEDVLSVALNKYGATNPCIIQPLWAGIAKRSSKEKRCECLSGSAFAASSRRGGNVRGEAGGLTFLLIL